ncbi:MAG: dethiobiotin synthase [Saprospiraceae bacterium]|nr:dethiobiotin synthase [Saprospiraceae bacterium]
MKKGVFVSGIGTEIGKTLVSAILTTALDADYWKPVQSGDLHHTDSMKVKQLSQGDEGRFHPEAFRLNTPASPHYSAAIDQVEIKLSDFSLPETENFLIVEGAGGLMVPLNDEQTILDLIQYLGIPVVLVSQHYLGSINHTLLSLNCLKERGIPLAGLIFNGPSTPSTSSIIQQMSGQEALFHLPELEEVNAEQVKYWANQIAPILRERWLA